MLPPSVVYGPRGATSSGTSEPSHVHRLQPNRYSTITPTLPPSCLRYMKYVHFSSSISGGYVLSASLSTTKPVSMP